MKRFVWSLLLLVALVVSVTGCAHQTHAARVAFIADTHLNFQTNGPLARCNSNFEKTLKAVNAAKVDLVVIAGDLTQNGSAGQMKLAKKQIRRFSAPTVVIPGNHDVGRAKSGSKRATINERRLGLFENKLGPIFFEKEKAGVRVLCITSPLVGSGLKAEARQWKFLEEELAKPSPKPTLVLEHYPVFFKNADEKPIGRWAPCPSLRGKYLDLLKKGDVAAVLSGHTHRQKQVRKDGILFVTNASSSKGRNPGWMLLDFDPKGQARSQFRPLNAPKAATLRANPQTAN